MNLFICPSFIHQHLLHRLKGGARICPAHSCSWSIQDSIWRQGGAGDEETAGENAAESINALCLARSFPWSSEAGGHRGIQSNHSHLLLSAVLCREVGLWAPRVEDLGDIHGDFLEKGA